MPAYFDHNVLLSDYSHLLRHLDTAELKAGTNSNTFANAPAPAPAQNRSMFLPARRSSGGRQQQLFGGGQALQANLPNSLGGATFSMGVTSTGKSMDSLMRIQKK